MAKSRDIPDVQALLDAHLQRLAQRRVATTPEPMEAPLRRVTGQLYAEPGDLLTAPPAPESEPPVVEEVPLPGRYAAGTAVGSWGSRLAGALGLRGHRSWSPASMAALCAGLALAGLGMASWAVLTRPDPVSPGPLTTSEVVPSPTVIAAVESDTIIVDVAGKVRRPGIAVLPSGSRVVDALEAAGGALPKADTSSLNLARVLTDGEQILVGVAPPAGVTPGPAGTAMVSLNSATAVELETLPQVGPVTAAAIIAWRTEHGAFRSVDELLEVDGIGEGTLAQLRPHVTL